MSGLPMSADTGHVFSVPKDCEACSGTGCPCAQWRDWWSMDYCECGCPECGLKPEPGASGVYREKGGAPSRAPAPAQKERQREPRTREASTAKSSVPKDSEPSDTMIVSSDHGSIGQVSYYTAWSLGYNRYAVVAEPFNGLYEAEMPTREAAQAYALALNTWLDARPMPDTLAPFFNPETAVMVAPYADDAAAQLFGVLDAMVGPETREIG